MVGEGVRLGLCGGERVIVGVIVLMAEIDAEREIVDAIERVRDGVLDSEGGIPMVPAKL